MIIIYSYLNISIDVAVVPDMNVDTDEKLRQQMARLKGVRLLRQDPVETLFTFICSSNNNIQRISSMVDKLCMTYGQHIAQVDIFS